MTLVHCTVASPLGSITLLAGDDGLRAVLPPADTLAPGLLHDRPRDDPAHPVLREAARQLEEYFAGDRRRFALPLALRGTPFQLTVWRALDTIPYGHTISYAQLACRAGRSGANRATGAANGRNPLSIVIPCHRVIATNGNLTGYSGGLQAKRFLLQHEARHVDPAADLPGVHGSHEGAR
jgi:methylated-DNA-[protein]-cysteine S-methyltransferase